MATGFLSIWSDIPTDQETDYLHWLTREHTSERLAIPGFLGVGVYRALDVGVSRYFIRYELSSSEVLTSPTYLTRLNSPSPWSRGIMPSLRNFVRGGGRVLAQVGTGKGGLIGVLKFSDATASTMPDRIHGLVDIDRIVAAEVLETDLGQTSVATREKSLRHGDGSFAGLLIVHGLDQAAVRSALLDMGDDVTGNIYGEIFRQ